MLYFLVVAKVLYVDIDHAEGSHNNNSALVVPISNSRMLAILIFFYILAILMSIHYRLQEYILLIYLYAMYH